LSFKAILDFKSALRLVKIKKPINNNKDIALNNYNNNIIIINISRSKNKRSKTQKLTKYIYILLKNLKKRYYY
jgi:hypothetical protein